MLVKIVLMLLCATAAKSIIVNNTQRIIGGSQAFAGQIPYIAAIYKQTNTGTYFCGGALMSNQWVITSGSCVDKAVQFTILLGIINLQELGPESLRLSTDDYVLHPDYNALTFENDIGLIKFRMPITFNDYIKPFDHLAKFDLVPAMGCMSMGWGQTSDESAGLEDDLQYVHLMPVTNDECKLTYGDQIKDTMVCVGYTYNEGFCHGDTGVPLIRYTNGPRSTHMGIASFISKNGCDTPEPSGYLRTFPYVEWIRNVTGVNK